MVMYSHSRLSTFEQCPKKFEFKYIDKIKIEGQSIEGLLGSSIHTALEILYNESKKKIILNIDELINIFTETWKENHDENILIVRNDLNESDYFNKGIGFLTDYYTKNYPFDDNTLETEKKIFLKLDEEGKYQMIGFIDRLVYNMKEKRYEVHDYKTANSIPKRKAIDKDRQLALYSIAIKNIFGQDKEVVLIWHYLAHNTKIESKRTNEQLEKLKEQTLKLIKKIESTTTFPCNKSPLCSWCEYKPICPAWNSKINFEKQKTLDV